MWSKQLERLMIYLRLLQEGLSIRMETSFSNYRTIVRLLCIGLFSLTKEGCTCNSSGEACSADVGKKHSR